MRASLFGDVNGFFQAHKASCAIRSAPLYVTHNTLYKTRRQACGFHMALVLPGSLCATRHALPPMVVGIGRSATTIVRKKGVSGTRRELWPVPQRWDCTSGVLAASRRSVAKGLDRWGRLARPKRPRGTVSVSQYTSRSLWRGGRTPSSQDKPPRRATALKRSGIDTLSGTEQVNRAILNTSLLASSPQWFLRWCSSLLFQCLFDSVVYRTQRLNGEFEIERRALSYALVLLLGPSAQCEVGL